VITQKPNNITHTRMKCTLSKVVESGTIAGILNSSGFGLKEVDMPLEREIQFRIIGAVVQ